MFAALGGRVVVVGNKSPTKGDLKENLSARSRDLYSLGILEYFIVFLERPGG